MKLQSLSVVTVPLVAVHCSAFSSSNDAKNRVGSLHGRDGTRSSRATIALQSAPIRKSGSLFGLSDYSDKTLKSGDDAAAATTSASAESLVARTDTVENDITSRKAKCNTPDEEKVSASDNSTITILHHKHPKLSAEAIDSPSKSNWESEMSLQLKDLDDLSLGSADAGAVVKEEEVDEIANELLSPPHREEADAEESSVGESLAVKRVKMKREAMMNRGEIQPVEIAEKSVDDDIRSWVDDSLGGSDTTLNDDNEISESRPLSPTHSIERASLSPTHSIEEEYEKMKQGAGGDVDADALLENEKSGVSGSGGELLMEDTTTPLGQEEDVTDEVLDSADGALLNASSPGSSNDVANLNPKGFSVPESGGKHSKSGKHAKVESTKEDDADVKPKLDVKSTQSEAKPKASFQTTTNEESSTAKAEEDKTAKLDTTQSSSPLEILLSTATSFLSPAPPPLPPTDTNIINSDSATSKNLVEINNQLQETLDSQRSDLGRLRRQVNDLERQLIRANRSKDSKMEEEVNARVESIREECERQVLVANETVALLQKEAERLFMELEDLTTSMAVAENERERVAAEYGYVIKSYVNLKHELEDGKKQIVTLEGQLADTTSKLKRYQKETQQWKDECANKANALESSNTRMVQLQSTIDGLQNVIRTKEDKIKSMSFEEAQERRRIISTTKQETRDEFEELLDKKSKKIGELRVALRSANEKKRHIERFSQRKTSEAMGKLRRELEGQMDELKALLEEKDLEVAAMKKIAEEAEGIIEDRERLLAEVMFMAKSVEVLQANLTMSTKTNEDIVQSYENEITKLREANVEKADEITGLVQVSSANIAKADLMESQLDDLTAKLNEEKLFNAGSSSELGKLAAKLDETEAQLIVLRNESQTLQAQFQELGKQKQTLEQTLADERERSDIVLEEKVTCIAILDQELAERLNELFSLNQTLGSVEHQLEEMTSKYSIEKERANNLEVDIRQLKENATLTADDSVSLVEATNPAELYKEKTNALVQRALLSEQIINNKLSEIANLRNELDEVSLLAKSQPADYAGTDELIAELNSEIAGLKLATRQSQAKANEKLLLQSQTVTDLSEQIKKLEESSSRAVTEAKQAQAETETTIAQLTSSLDNTKKEYDQKISVAEIALKTKEERITQLQNDIDKMIKSQKEESKSSSKTKEESSKAKEKLLLKNQLIKEKEDVISQLNNQLNDLQFEKEHIEQTLQAEIKRNEDFYHSHELQLKEMKEKLKEQHAADVTKMNETVLQHELEIQSLKEKLAESVSLRRQSSAVDKHHAELLIVQELQNSLQQSKKKEVELINRNMMLKNKVEFLEARSKMLTTPLSDEPSKKQESVPAEIGLPSYYKESKRSRIRRVIGSIWGRITRRNKN